MGRRRPGHLRQLDGLPAADQRLRRRAVQVVDTREEAERAFASSPYAYIGRKAAARQPQKAADADGPLPPEVVENSLAVDAACSGNPGQMEYRGVHVASRQQVFHYGPVYGTNNIGEFLAIVHGLALLKQRDSTCPSTATAAMPSFG